jgi:hypothetical protein
MQTAERGGSRKLLVEIRNTPYEEGIRRTFAWLDKPAA